MKQFLPLLLLVFINQINAQIISTIVGNGSGAGTYTCCYSGDGGQAINAELNAPYGIAIDALKNVYIADGHNHVIRKVDTSGIITTIAGIDSLGFSGDGGIATLAKLSNPTSVAIDSFGNLYIADTDNCRIRRVSTTGIITTVVGNGTFGYAGDGGQAAAAEIHYPRGLTFDTHGNLYFADSYNHVIRKVDTAGIITTIAGMSTVWGAPYGEGGLATNAALNYPTGVAVDVIGNVYIIDMGQNRIHKVDTNGIINFFAGNGVNLYSGDGGPADSAGIQNPNGIAFDASGNLYIADTQNHRVRVINTSGIINTFAGNGIGGFSGDGGLATNAELHTPYGVATDAFGNVYIADTENNRIRKVSNSCNPTLSFTLIADTLPHTWDAYPTYSTNVTNARWYWGDGTSTMALYPSHTYSVANMYNICVTAYSSCGDSIQNCQNDSVYRADNSSSIVQINVLNSSTGIKISNEIISTVNIFPNPSSNSITINSSKELSIISIYNSYGEIVLRICSKSKTEQIDVSKLPCGVYVIQANACRTKFIKE